MRGNNLISYIINAAIFIILEVAALNMLRYTGTMQNIWFSKACHTVMATVWGGTQNIAQYFSLRKTNDELAQENFELKIRLAQMDEAIAESISENQTSDLAGNFRYIPATIAKISNNTEHNYIIINKGSDDGIRSGSGIITWKGAIGIIDAVGRKYSYARSFKNHEMSISTRIGKEGAVGPMSWDGFSSNGAVLKEIPHHVEFAPGDTVYTSGFSSIFPAGIPLGTIGEAKIVNGSTYEIKISLFEDFSAIRYITVVENDGKEEIEKLEAEQ
ncbi:MAG: rod shape-determining protein MreC [Candidatus Cryptobacteroides sp.]